MNKKFIVLGLLLVFFSTLAFSQEFERWKFVREIGPKLDFAHGVTVTPDDCIWVAVYSGNAGEGIPAGAIVILNPDGSRKDMITGVSFEGTDYTFAAARGISTDYEGNVLYSSADVLYKIDYRTYGCLGRTVPKAGVSITTAVSDGEGNIVVGFVVAGDGDGYLYYGPDLDFKNTVIDKSNVTNPSYTRDIAITPDGKYLYLGCTSGSSVAQYYSENGIYESYVFVKHIGTYGAVAQTVQLDAKGRLWIGSYTSDLGSGKYDCWDLEKNEIVGGFTSVEYAATSDEGDFQTVRGLAFSNDGKKAYISNAEPCGILEWEIEDGSSNAEQPKVIPEGFVLSQNYPNPFNPTTNFSYSVPKASDVRIAVYDLFGREIKTLVNESKDAGEYNITWNGRDNNNKQVSTGVYFYKMRAAGFEKTMKMMLMK